MLVSVLFLSDEMPTCKMLQHAAELGTANAARVVQQNSKAAIALDPRVDSRARKRRKL